MPCQFGNLHSDNGTVFTPNAFSDAAMPVHPASIRPGNDLYRKKNWYYMMFFPYPSILNIKSILFTFWTFFCIFCHCKMLLLRCLPLKPLTQMFFFLAHFSHVLTKYKVCPFIILHAWTNQPKEDLLTCEGSCVTTGVGMRSRVLLVLLQNTSIMVPVQNQRCERQNRRYYVPHSTIQIYFSVMYIHEIYKVHFYVYIYFYYYLFFYICFL